MGAVAPVDERQWLAEELAEVRALVERGEFDVALGRLAEARQSAVRLADDEVLKEIQRLDGMVWQSLPSRGWGAIPEGGLIAWALAAVLVTVVPSLIGWWLEISVFRDWGVIAAYLGLSWLLPAVLLGRAVSSWASRRRLRHARALAIAAAVGVGFWLLIVSLGSGYAWE